MLYCCQRLEKFTFDPCAVFKVSGFPRWTKVKSWRIKPLERQTGKKERLNSGVSGVLTVEVWGDCFLKPACISRSV